MPLPQDTGIVPNTAASLAQYANDQFNARANGTLEDRVAAIETALQQILYMLAPTATRAAAALTSLPAHESTHIHGGSDPFLPGASSILPGDILDGSARFGVGNNTFSPGAAPAAQTSPLYRPTLTFAGIDLLGYDADIAFGVTEVAGSSVVYARYQAPTPFYTVKGYINNGFGTNVHLDSTYFDGGINQPGGVTQFTTKLFANGPGGSVLIMGCMNFAMWFRIGLTNTTAGNITVNWFVPWVDNGNVIIWNGATQFNKATADGALSNNSGTFTVNAGVSGYLDLFFYNENGPAPNDGSNPSIFSVWLDALTQTGMTFY